MKLGHINISSLVTHFADLLHLMVDSEFDMLGASKTWLDPSVQVDAHSFLQL